MTSDKAQRADLRPGDEGQAREVVYIDPAYDLATVRKRGQLQFVRSRDRGGYFDFVWGVHPFVGLLGNRWARRIRRERFDERQIVFDGFEEGRQIPWLLIPINVLIALFRLTAVLLRVAKRREVKAIYVADIFAGGLIGLVLSRLSRKPLIVAVYVNQDENWEANRKLIAPRLLPSRRLEQFVSRRVLKAATMVDVGAENMRDYVVNNGADPPKVVLLPIVKFISDVHFAEPLERPDPGPLLHARGVPDAPVYLLYVGRLKIFKHPDDAVAAMARVIGRHPEVIGLLAGEGEMKDSLRADIEKLSMTGRILLLGDCDHNMLAAIAPHCITIAPLSGMALVETCLAGSPPVAYDRDWQPEFIDDGRSGFIVPFRDVAAMAEKASMLVEDEKLRHRLGGNARQRALDLADREKHARRERAAMERALEGEQSRSSVERQCLEVTP